MVGGRRIVDRVIAAIVVATGENPVLITSSVEAPAWKTGLEIIPDVAAGPQSSLRGILTAIMAGTGPVLITGWDMPFIAASLLTDLVARSAGFDAYLPEGEPLCGVYTPACAEPIRLQLERGERKAVAFHSQVRAGLMPRSAVERFGEPGVLFFNVNSAVDLAEAEELWRNRRG